jgi:hypothetical protein
MFFEIDPNLLCQRVNYTLKGFIGLAPGDNVINLLHRR